MKNTKVTHIISGVILSVAVLCSSFSYASATEGGTTFQVNVKEVLSVSVATPTSWMAGNIDTFLLNKVSLNVTSNNSAGFVATMTTKTSNTSLTNTSKSTFTLPTLDATSYPSGVARNSFPANYWGYSFDDTDAGSGTSTYKALVGAGSTPITVLSSNTATTGNRDFYFGAKADATKAAGTYVGTVVINVVSGVKDENTNPTTPTNPVTPSNDEIAVYNPSPIGGSSNGTTSYSYTNTSGGVSTTTTEVSDGNNVNSYDNYTPPQGVTYKTTSDVNGGISLATGLAVTASVAAASGMFFFILAKRKEDDEEEEEEEQQP